MVFHFILVCIQSSVGWWEVQGRTPNKLNYCQQYGQNNSQTTWNSNVTFVRSQDSYRERKDIQIWDRKSNKNLIWINQKYCVNSLFLNTVCVYISMDKHTFLLLHRHIPQLWLSASQKEKYCHSSISTSSFGSFQYPVFKRKSSKKWLGTEL